MRLMKGIKALFFPPRCPFCGEALRSGERCCPRCRERLASPGVERRLGARGEWPCLAALAYEDWARELLIAMKRPEHREYARPLAELLASRARQARPGLGEDWIVVCVPNFEPEGRRVYNAARVLARNTARELGLPFLPDALVQPREKRRQHTLGVTERRANVAGLFLPGPESVRERRVLLIDDIVTTGATLCDCARVLEGEGAAEILCAAAAAAGPPQRT